GDVPVFPTRRSSDLEEVPDANASGTSFCMRSDRRCVRSGGVLLTEGAQVQPDHLRVLEQLATGALVGIPTLIEHVPAVTDLQARSEEHTSNSSHVKI